MQCGPLIRLWTLRFESKHSYFKKTVRPGQNFKNITKTCAEKHQLLQAYYSAGSLFGPVISLTCAMPFHFDIYSVENNKAVRSNPFLTNSTATEVADVAVVDSIKYEKGMFVVIRRELENLHVGSIKLILACNQAIYFVTEPKCTSFDFDMGVYVIVTDDEPYQYQCIAITDLLDKKPLHSYKQGLSEVLVLHHAV